MALNYAIESSDQNVLADTHVMKSAVHFAAANPG